ncbi:MAG TPA: VTT domain-containing protein, partial [Candidatus Thermoplasmatota archaeon]|nr:VTT domain-containing protein [Candidatus Thermoplasmatota archaeon]
LVTVVAKVCAGWMVFFVGDSVNHQMRKRAQTSERWARFLDWSERFASRFGVGALTVFIATPGLPDAVALYVFGALHMRLPRFLVGIALGSAILNGLILYGIGHLLGI